MIVEWLNPILEWSGLSLIPFLLVVIIFIKLFKD